MSTRCFIGYSDEKKPKKKATSVLPKFNGVYSHWDGYPSNVGKFIHEKITEWATKGVRQYPNEESEEKRPLGTTNLCARTFANIFIKGHPAGWSSISSGECYCHSPYFVGRDGLSDNLLNEKSDLSWLEYGYIIYPETAEMEVWRLSSAEFGGNRRLTVVNLTKPWPKTQALN